MGVILSYRPFLTRAENTSEAIIVKKIRRGACPQTRPPDLEVCFTDSRVDRSPSISLAQKLLRSSIEMALADGPLICRFHRVQPTVGNLSPLPLRFDIGRPHSSS
jgi:hypothetical protein